MACDTSLSISCVKGYLDWLAHAEEVDPVNFRKQVSVAEVEEEEAKEKGCFGRMMEKIDAVNRRVRPRCRRAVKSQAMFWVIVTLGKFHNNHQQISVFINFSQNFVLRVRKLSCLFS